MLVWGTEDLSVDMGSARNALRVPLAPPRRQLGAVRGRAAAGDTAHATRSHVSLLPTGRRGRPLTALTLLVLVATAGVVDATDDLPRRAARRVERAATSSGNPFGRVTICTVALNDPHELEAIRSELDDDRFRMIDLRQLARRGASSIASSADEASWLDGACTPALRCDVLVITAEFAGRFFGKNGPSFSLQDLEEAACRPECRGVFRTPLEVLLLACNTLASKDEDSRTPEQYLEVLLDHGFDRAAAERVVALRYGPLGPSFRESLRRIFAGVPRIYGFASVAPRAEYSAPMLTRYFRDQDYAGTLRRLGNTAGTNSGMLRAFRNTSLIQIPGLRPDEPGAGDRTQICALYDEQRSVAERLRVAYGLLLRSDALSFVPTLEVFLRRHPPPAFSPIERSILGEIQALDGPREAVLTLVARLNVSALQLEMAHFAERVGWLHPSELHALAVSGAASLLTQPLSAEVVDIMCEIQKHVSLRDDFRADDIPAPVYRDAQGLRLLACLAPSDPRVAPKILPALRSGDPMTRQWAAYALTQLLPRDRAVLVELVPYLRDPEIGERVRWMFRAQGDLPPELRVRLDAAEPTHGPPARQAAQRSG